VSAQSRTPTTLADLAREFVQEVGAALQAMEAARPGLEGEPLREWLRTDPEGMIGYSLCRNATVAACMALLRIWYPSGDSFSIAKLSVALNRAFPADDPALASLRALLKRDNKFEESLASLVRWRNKRIAHRVSLAIAAERPEDRRAMQSDFDRVLERSLEVVDALRTALPNLELPDLKRARDRWRQNAHAF
jgi:hypothetical protein